MPCSNLCIVRQNVNYGFMHICQVQIFRKIDKQGICMYLKTYSWGIKGFNKSLFYGVKLPSLRAMWAKNGLILPLEKLIHFFLGPWLLAYQSIEISNQMESNGVASNFVTKILCNSVLHNFCYPKFDTSPFDSI